MEDDHEEDVSATTSIPLDANSQNEHSDKKRERERSSTPLVDDEESESESVGKIGNKRVKVVKELLSHLCVVCFDGHRIEQALEDDVITGSVYYPLISISVRLYIVARKVIQPSVLLPLLYSYYMYFCFSTELIASFMSAFLLYCSLIPCVL